MRLSPHPLVRIHHQHALAQQREDRPVEARRPTMFRPTWDTLSFTRRAASSIARSRAAESGSECCELLQQHAASRQDLIERQGDLLVDRLDRLRRRAHLLRGQQVERVQGGGDLLAEQLGELQVVRAEAVRPAGSRR